VARNSREVRKSSVCLPWLYLGIKLLHERGERERGREKHEIISCKSKSSLLQAFTPTSPENESAKTKMRDRMGRIGYPYRTSKDELSPALVVIVAVAVAVVVTEK
jgi:hypothetical protein